VIDKPHPPEKPRRPPHAGIPCRHDFIADKAAINCNRRSNGVQSRSRILDLSAIWSDYGDGLADLGVAGSTTIPPRSNNQRSEPQIVDNADDALVPRFHRDRPISTSIND